MELKLYHYIHCPYCIRVRMVLGFLGLEFESIVLRYDDEETPIRLAKKKMLPIMDFGNGFITNESLIIIENLDKNDLLKTSLVKGEVKTEIENMLDELGSNIHSLCMPFFIESKEFDEKSREYFLKKKEAKRGPFKDLILNKEKFLEPLQEDLLTLEEQLNPFFLGEEFSIFDILVASHLWSLYLLPNFNFSENLESYLQEVKNLCNFEYHRDLVSN
jgi:glutaredoxin 2